MDCWMQLQILTIGAFAQLQLVSMDFHQCELRVTLQRIRFEKHILFYPINKLMPTNVLEYL